MSIESSSITDEVVELLATWGASGSAGVSDLLEVLSEFTGQPQPSIMLRRALEVGEILDAGQRRELRELEEAAPSPGRAADPEWEARLTNALERLDTDLESGILRERSRTESELASWLPLMSSAERQQALALLWQGAAGSSNEENLAAAAGLLELRTVVGTVQERTRREVEQLLKSGALDGDADATAEARAALGPDALEELARTARQLERFRGREEKARAETRVEEARVRLADLCRQARDTLERDPAESATPFRGLLSTTLEGAEKAMKIEQSGGASSTGSDGGPEALDSWVVALGTILDPGSAEAVGGSSEALARSVLDDLESERANSPESRARSLESAKQELQAGLDQGARSLDDALFKAAAMVQASRKEADEELRGPCAKLQESASRLEALLAESARLLPAQRVARSRLLLESVTSEFHHPRIESVEALNVKAEQELDEVQKVARGASKQRHERDEAKRRRLLEVAGQKVELARGRAAARMRSVVSELENADPDELEALEEDLRELSWPVDNEIRLEAISVLDRFGSSSKSRRDPATKRSIASLRDALEGDDLPSIAQLTDELRRSAPIRFHWSGPVVWIIIAAVLITAMVAYVYVPKYLAQREKVYRLAFDGDVTGAVEVSFVTRGEVRETRQFDPGSEPPLEVELPPGRYEIYIDGRYTGRIIRAPDDPTEISSVPLPSGVE